MTIINKILNLSVLCFFLFGCGKKVVLNSVDYSISEVSKPILFGEGIISITDRSVFDVTFSPNGKTAYFTTRKGNDKQKIMESNYENYTWTTPKVFLFSTDRDETPYITNDGNTLYFGSQRALEDYPNEGNFDMNIWKVSKTKMGWSSPSPLSQNINQSQIKDEEWPSSNANLIYSNNDVDFIYCTMKRGTKSINIYETKLNNGEFSSSTKIENLFDDEKYWKYAAIYSRDGKYLIFNSSNVPIGVGGEDIFVSKKIANGWSKAVSIGNLVNTKAEESSPRFSRDGKYFFFARENRINSNEDGIWSIYFIETKYLELDKLFKN